MMIIFVLMLVLILIWIINKLYIHTNYYKNNIIFENRYNRYSMIPTNLEIVNLGSGYARFSFSYDDFPLKGFNFAQSPQSLYYDFQILKQYKSHLKEDCIVLINLPLFIFCFENYKKIQYEQKYYWELEKEYIYNYSWIKKIIYLHFPVLVAGKKAGHILKDIKSDTPYEKSYCIYSNSEVNIQVENHYNVWKEQFQLKATQTALDAQHLEDNFVVCVDILKDMIEFCLNNHWRPVLITTPLCGKLNDRFGVPFINKVLYSNIEKANIYDIPYWDFCLCAEYQNDKDMFWNGVDWMSQKGRDYFMKVLWEKIDATL